MISQWRNISVFKTLQTPELLENQIAQVLNSAFMDITPRQLALVVRLSAHYIFSFPPSLLDTLSSNPSIG